MIKIKNNSIIQVANFLKLAKLTGRYSRYRTKLLSLLEVKISELGNDEKSIVEESGAKLDENGNITGIPSDDVAVKIQQELADVRFEKSIFNETIDGQFNKLYKALSDYDEALSGEQAQAYDELMEALEEGGHDVECD